ncbi:hypothetical protein [Catellatospora tritici]|uniref:hypothetical protein n=1 Tax=Catellatospora tritici TaxID=2851566 RepID=UPI001C2D28C1|nr:hypothetical protein [Catellatospora tritici]MBV1855483.1 hypothetical protein [Catellatospora tritici]
MTAPHVTTAATAADPTAAAPTTAATGKRRVPWRTDALALAAYVGLVLLVTWRVWPHPRGLYLGVQPPDQLFNEWMLANDAHTLTDPTNPFFTSLQNAPLGVNLVTNVGLQLLGFLTAPITLLLGATASYLLIMTMNLVATAYAWYWVLSRHVVRSPWAAALGGAFLGFCPAIISQSSGHPHITAQWLLPFILWQVVRLTTPGPVLRRGLVLGALITVQFFLGLEVLFLTALGCGMAALAYAVLRRREAVKAAPRALGSLAIAGVIVLAFAAYPMWMQFAGPQHRTGHPLAGEHALGLGAFFKFASQSLAGGPGSGKGFTPNATEETSFLGWPLLLLVAVLVVWLRRDLAVRVLAVAGAIAGLLSLGPEIGWHRGGSWFTGPYALIEHLPVMDSVVPARFALITTVTVGLLLALATDRIITDPPRLGALPPRPLYVLALAAALLPIAPTPLPVKARPHVPAFITAGTWKQYVAPGHTLVPVPIDNYVSLNWSARALTGFAVPQGYFLGPTSATDSTGRWGAIPQPTSVLLTDVAAGKRGTDVTDADRAQALADARYWKADALVLPVAHRAAAQLHTVMDALYGPGTAVGDVWVWDVRGR